MKYLLLLVVGIQSFLFATTDILVSYENKATYPYYTKEGSKNLGLAIDALKSIEKEFDLNFIFKREPGTRGQNKLKYDKVDLLLFASYKKAREEIGVYPKTADGKVDTDKRSMNLSYMLYKLKGSSLDWDGEKFINLTGSIGATRGYSIVKVLKKLGVKVKENNLNNTDILKLIKGRIQGVVNQSSKIDLYLSENPKLASQVEKVKTPVKTKPYYMLFSKGFYKNNPKLTNKIWESLKHLDSNPKFKSFRDKY